MVQLKRKRRNRSELQVMDDLICSVVEENKPCTVRQVFYLVTSQGAVEKTEAGYRKIQSRLMHLRKSNKMPWYWLADNTRWRHGRQRYYSAADAVKSISERFYLNIESYQDTRLEVWAEKDAITGVLTPITEKYGVDLMTCRGFPSFTFLMGASDAASQDDRPFKIIYLGDHDPSGAIIDRKVQEHMQEHYEGVFLGVERIAVRPEQVKEFNLLTRPTKATDSRAKNFSGNSVEVDAIPPLSLRSLLENAIQKHIDSRVMENAMRLEKMERETLKAIAGDWDNLIQNI